MKQTKIGSKMALRDPGRTGQVEVKSDSYTVKGRSEEVI
jgi:hypothetical protein